MTRLSTAAPLGVATTLACSIVLGVVGVTTENALAALPSSVSDPIERADRALTRAGRHLALDHPKRAIDALLVVTRQVRRANYAAMHQVGKLPTTPRVTTSLDRRPSSRSCCSTTWSPGASWRGSTARHGPAWWTPCCLRSR
jgi:hypothetical protein